MTFSLLANNVTVNLAGTDGFNDTVSGIGKVEADHFVFGTDNGMVLEGLGAWTLTINGSIFGGYSVAPNPPGGLDGLVLDTSAVSPLFTSSITVGATGSIYGGGGAGIRTDHATKLINSGQIVGSVDGFATDSTGAITITNNKGAVLGGFTGHGIFFDTAASGIHTVTNSGDLGTDTGVAIESLNSSATDKITNSGNIVGDVLLGGGDDTFTNSGVVDAIDTDLDGFVKIDLGTGNNTFSNTKTISGEVIFDLGNDKFTNSGVILATVDLGDGVDTVTNSGTINADGEADYLANIPIGTVLNLGAGVDTVTNSGKGIIYGDVDLGAGENKLTNSAKIYGSVFGDIGPDTITNSGTIDGDVLLQDGTNKVTNSGTITGDLVLGIGADTVLLSGKGTVQGTITLGDGDDTLTGGTANDIVADGAGKDTVKLGGGDDRYFALSATTGTDIVDGGLGTADEYNAFGALNSVVINLNTLDQNDKYFAGTLKTYAKSTAYGLDVSNDATGLISKDTVTGFENATGGDVNDLLIGGATANSLNGSLGDDVLYGLAGNDTLDGGEGSDTIIGGAGKDQLLGSASDSNALEFDVFVYTSLSDSGLTSATRDLIIDFDVTDDVIDLSAIAVGATYVGENTVFNGGTSVRGMWTALNTLVQLDTNGDQKVDFSIEIEGHVRLTAANFDFIV